ncbi:MAG: hypothetical protein ABSH22_04355 [Tepidisphaeraceae bacterium]
MNLADVKWTGTGGHANNGTVGRERSEWYAVATLSVESGYLGVSDLFDSSFVGAEVQRGVYFVEARIIEFGGCLRISRLRASAGAENSSRGEIRGHVAVDGGCVMVADFKDIRASLTPAEVDEFAQLSSTFRFATCDICRLNFESKTIFFVLCESGFGDGRYPVYALNAEDRCVGIEVEFIKDGPMFQCKHD